jgi:hypothetical protein
MPNTNDYRAPTRLIAVPAWNKYHEWPPVGGLRHLIFHAKRNGFDHVVRRVGRRVLLDEAAFFAWVEKTGAKK